MFPFCRKWECLNFCLHLNWTLLINQRAKTLRRREVLIKIIKFLELTWVSWIKMLEGHSDLLSFVVIFFLADLYTPCVCCCLGSHRLWMHLSFLPAHLRWSLHRSGYEPAHRACWGLSLQAVWGGLAGHSCPTGGPNRVLGCEWAELSSAYHYRAVRRFFGWKNRSTKL